MNKLSWSVKNKNNKDIIEIGVLTIGALKFSDVLEKRYPGNFIIRNLMKEVVLLSLVAYVAYFAYVRANIRHPKRVAYATDLLIASPIPPFP